MGTPQTKVTVETMAVGGPLEERGLVKLIALFGIAVLLSDCTTADTRLGITTNEGPRTQETLSR